MQLHIPKLACAACVATVTTAIKTLDSTAQIVADPKTKLVDIDAALSEAEVRSALAGAGYPAS